VEVFIGEISENKIKSEKSEKKAKFSSLVQTKTLAA